MKFKSVEGICFHFQYWFMLLLYRYSNQKVYKAIFYNINMGGKKIMLVEDDDSIRFLARKVIEHHGYEVEDFAHGLSAFRRLVELNSQERPNYYGLILSDIDMPQMDGLAFAAECAKITTKPVVLMTGRTREPYPSNVREVLQKPLLLSEYKRLLETYVPRF